MRASITNPGFRRHFYKSDRNIFIVLVIVPIFSFFLVWFYWPILVTMGMSLFNVDTYLIQKPTFVGFGNYLKAINNPVVWEILRNTFVFTIVTTVIGTVLAVLVALLLESISSFKAFFRTLYFIPVITSMIVVSLMWKWLYQPRFGLFNVVLEALHLPTQKWLNDPSLALMCIAAMSIWKGLGFSVVIAMAGLGGIPREFQEAARVDGAGAWQNFWSIKLPLLRPTLVFLMVTGVIGNLQVFTPMYIMTQGGPFNSTQTIVYEIYNQAFVQFHGGYASALAIILLLLTLFVSYIQVRLTSTKWEY
jgi:ABC-type sugar transport system permease subunit